MSWIYKLNPIPGIVNRIMFPSVHPTYTLKDISRKDEIIMFELNKKDKL
mgnify:CR=1 FL=1